MCLITKTERGIACRHAMFVELGHPIDICTYMYIIKNSSIQGGVEGENKSLDAMDLLSQIYIVVLYQRHNYRIIRDALYHAALIYYTHTYPLSLSLTHTTRQRTN